jgi:rod shape-determining protein MreD
MKNTVFFYVKLILLIIILLTLQSSAIFSIFEVNPDFILILTLLFNLEFGEYKGMFFGFIIGLLEDSVSSVFLGLNSFVLTFLSWFLGLYKKYIFVSDVFSFSVFLIIATIIKYVLYVFFYWIFHTELLSWFLIVKLAGEIIYNLLFGTGLYYLIPFILKKRSEIF